MWSTPAAVLALFTTVTIHHSLLIIVSVVALFGVAEHATAFALLFPLTRRDNDIATAAGAAESRAKTRIKCNVPSRLRHRHYHVVRFAREVGDDSDDSYYAKTIRDVLWRMTLFFSEMVDTNFCPENDITVSSSATRTGAPSARTRTTTSRFYYECFPPTGERVHRRDVPIRDLAAAWDATKIVNYWKQVGTHEYRDVHGNHRHAAAWNERLTDAVRCTIEFYNSSYVPIPTSAVCDARDGSSKLALDPDVLAEPSNIAHSALMILAATGAIQATRQQPDGNHGAVDDDSCPQIPLEELVRGLLSMQHGGNNLDDDSTCGAFQIEFLAEKPSVYHGIEFYPGEAMVALMDAYVLSLDVPDTLSEATGRAILSSLERAFEFYSNYYRSGDVDTNYNVWQVQAFARYYDVLVQKERYNVVDDPMLSRRVADSCLEMCQDIVNSKAWKYELARGSSFYPNLGTIEISCGLDALADGIRVALSTKDTEPQAAVLLHHAKNAVNFLHWAQDQVPADAPVGRGGLGHGGINVLAQRLDVSGHAVSALTKLYKLRDKL